MPMHDYDIQFRPATRDEESQTIEMLRAHARNVGGVVTMDEPFSLLVEDKGKLVASLIGKIFWNWLYVDLLWVKDQKCGLGSRLMKLAEYKAREARLTGIYCWTASWQAPGFYIKMGYDQFVVFEDFPPGHRRFGFRKYL